MRSNIEKKQNVLVSLVLMALFLWLFLISIKLFGGTFKHYFKADAKSLIENATSNPIVSLLIGILSTAIIQSSSSTTSIIIAFVGAGTLSLTNAVPMIMGANIGTSVTNTIVSFGNIRSKIEFQRSFASAIVHDFFNIMAVIIFLPLEIYTHFISRSSSYLTEIFIGSKGIKFNSPLDAIVKPVAAKVEYLIASLLNNPITEKVKNGHLKYEIEYSTLLLIVMVAISLVLLFVSLKYMSQIMKSLLLGKFEKILHKYVFNNMFTAILFGLLFTISVQSSSITTSLVVPLVGAGILTLEQIFPYTVGANIGTTITGILASIVTGQPSAITIALVHTLFNVMAGAVFLPLKALPIFLSKWFSTKCSENKFYAIGYIIVVFFIVPISLIGLFK